jgi:hypothetical protein
MSTSVVVPNTGPGSFSADDPNDIFLAPGTAFGVGNTALTLEQGMTAGIGTSSGGYSNPPIVPGGIPNGIQPYGGNPVTAPKRVGIMRNFPGSLPDGDVNYLYFIFNPNQIVASFITNINQIPAGYLYGLSPTSSSLSGLNQYSSSGGAVNPFSSTGAPSSTTPAGNVPNLTSGQTVSWSLIFDRTYDIMYSPNALDNRGVLKDVAALYALMGTFESTGAVPISTPIQVVFAANEAGQLWGFTGFITSVTITYGIFRWDMMPSRCEIDLQMMTSYVPPAVASSGAPSVRAPSFSANPNVAALQQIENQPGFGPPPIP